MIRRQRDPEHPEVPEDMSELTLDGTKWACTLQQFDEDGNALPTLHFLRVDEFTEEGRILIFASDTQLSQLTRAPAMMMDGNHKMAPRGFMQLYIIHAPMGMLQ